MHRISKLLKSYFDEICRGNNNVNYVRRKFTIEKPLAESLRIFLN